MDFQEADGIWLGGFKSGTYCSFVPLTFLVWNRECGVLLDIKTYISAIIKTHILKGRFLCCSVLHLCSCSHSALGDLQLIQKHSQTGSWIKFNIKRIWSFVHIKGVILTKGLKNRNLWIRKAPYSLPPPISNAKQRDGAEEATILKPFPSKAVKGNYSSVGILRIAA